MNSKTATLLKHAEAALKARVPQITSVTLERDDEGQYLMCRYKVPFLMQATGQVTYGDAAVSERLYRNFGFLEALELVTGFFTPSRRAFLAAQPAELVEADRRAREAGGFLHPDRYLECAA